ncbi:acyltransferase family protein [Vibrio sp. RC27]
MNNRLEYIDSIRGIAAILVFVYHCCETVGIRIDFVDLGRIGVVVFFIISGFIIPLSLQDDTHQPIKRFLIKRFFRLYPVYWASIILSVLILFLFNHAEFLEKDIFVNSVSQVIINFSMIQKAFGVENVLGPYWTLFIELVFYGACAALFYIKQLHSIKTILALIVLFSLGALVGGFVRFQYGINLPIILPIALSVMFYGSFLRYYLINNRTELLLPLVAISIFYMVCLFITFKLYYQDVWVRWYLTYFFSFFFCILLLTKVKIRNKIFVYLGKISYSFYLLHMLCIAIVFHYFKEMEISFVLATLVSLFFTIVLSDLSYRFIEMKSISMGRRFVTTS